MRTLLTLLLCLLPLISAAQWPTTVEEHLLVSLPYDPLTPGTAGIANYSFSYPDNYTLVIYWNGLGPQFQVIDPDGYLVHDIPQYLCPGDSIHGSSTHSKSKSDGRGGVVHMWKKDFNPSFIRAQRIDSLRNVCWGDSALRIFDFAESSNDFCSDGNGGWFFVSKYEIGIDDDIRLQHVSPEGHIMLPDSGLTLYRLEYAGGHNLKIAPDNAGGFYIVWREMRPPYTTWSALFAQHYNAEYQPVWNADGILIAPGIFYHQLLPDGENGVIVYGAPNAGDWHHAYRISPEGNLLWELEQLGRGWQDTKIVPGDPGFFYIGIPYFPTETVYGQKIDIDGNILWPTSGGTGTGAYMGSTDIYELRPPIDFAYRDGNFYAFFLYRRDIAGSPDDSYALYVQSLDQDGNRRYGLEGRLISQHVDSNQVEPRMTVAPDGFGGAVAVWDLAREGSYHDILAKRVDSNGNLGGPVWAPPPVQPDPEGGTPFLSVSNQTIHYTISIPGEVTIELYNVLGRQLSSTSFFHQQAGVFSTSLPTNGLASGIYFLRLSTPLGEAVKKVVVVR
ncbi:T9SS type A sorting domain-containing protein [bacterium]|nr:T9SS type A sorting domain-containing protein [bacterium]MBU1652235.1 T9SS type A sorting domain-containing protein [bacterium]